jgi:uncharacterized repeat protein (TIGR02543 family)
MIKATSTGGVDTGWANNGELSYSDIGFPGSSDNVSFILIHNTELAIVGNTEVMINSTACKRIFLDVAPEKHFPDDKDILSFNFATSENPGLSKNVIGTVNATTIDLVVPFGTNISSLVPDIRIDGATVFPADGDAVNFSGGPVTYTVEADDSTIKVYTVSVVTALPTYTVTYNANTGSGGVPADSNSYLAGATVTVLGSGTLTKTGYIFTCWNTLANGSGTDRAPASTFAIGSANVTLYAKWTALPTYTVTYNANTGSGGVPADSNSYLAGATVTVLGSGTLTKTGYIFTCWNTLANGSGTDRAPASTFAIGSANVTLYAKWTSCPIPTLTTTGITTIAGITAASGGNITNQGGAAVTQRGVCWSTSPNPTISNSKTSDGSGTGTFTSLLTALNQDTLYYVRAYATNSGGTAYGNELSFNSGKAYGTMYQGGLVFYNDGNGHGCVVQPLYTIADQPWSNKTNAASGATDWWAGQANTTAIISQAGHTNSAAKACDIYSDGTYSDWYLPAFDQLYMMYYNLHANGLGNFRIAGHWSSTEGSATTAWFQGFDPIGGSVDDGKSWDFSVRAIRDF